MTTQDKIRDILKTQLTVQLVQVTDQSSLHDGHPEAQKSGGGHYSIIVVSSCFADKNLLERHRMIYQALQKELRGEIHALSIKAFSPEEYSLGLNRESLMIPYKKKGLAMKKKIVIWLLNLTLVLSIPLTLKAEEGPTKMTNPIVVFETNQGTIELKLWPEVAPKACENMIGLVKKGYYDGIIFHRVIKGFMIQGGDPTGTGRGGESLWGGMFEDEFREDVSFDRPGLLAMAKGFCQTTPNDHEKLRLQFPVYDALYAYCVSHGA